MPRPSRLLVAAAVLAAALLGAGPARAAGAVPFPSGLPWYNVSRPLTLAELKGRAVLLDFFTPGCINCVHMLPVERRLEQRFGERLVIIGVDSPKFAASATTQGLIDFIHRYGIRHPVALDASSSLWDAYEVAAWPTLVLIGPDATVRDSFIGEKSFDELAGPIRSALADAPPASRLKPLPMLVMAGSSSPLSAPNGLAVSATLVAIADTGHNRIVLAGHDGKVQSLIGNGCAGAADGGYAEARFDQPHGLAFHDGSLYVADTGNQRIRRIGLAHATVTSIAGNGRRQFLGGGIFRATGVALNSPWDVAVGDGMLYIAMAGDHQVWRMNLATGRIGPWAGTAREGLRDGSLDSAEFAQPSGLGLHGDTLYDVDPESSSVRDIDLASGKVRTLVGQGLFKFGHRDGPAGQALLQHAEGIAWLGGSLYIADTFNNALRRLDLDSGKVSTLANDLQQPVAVAPLDARTLLVAESGGNRIVAVATASGKVTPWHLEGLKAPAASCPAGTGADSE